MNKHNTLKCRNQKATVMGLGRHGGGVAAARFLAQRGASVTVTDLADAGALRESIAALADVPIVRWRLGGHAEEDFSNAEIVVVNPSVRPNNQFVHMARQRGATIASEMELFLRLCPGHVVGVTGSNGKSTTATMIAAILESDGRRCFLGGNIGWSLLGEVERMRADDWIVLELSSFQLALLSSEVPMPEVAVVTNCAANHLDWHGTFADYRAAKLRLVAEQDQDALAIINTADAGIADWSQLAKGRTIPLVEEERLPPLVVPGQHNRQNAVCAATAALAVGCGKGALDRGLQSFRGLPHRLELVGEVAGRRFYNDSTATTPESTMAALTALDRPTWLLAGGKSKGAQWGALGDLIARLARGACFYGDCRAAICEAVLAEGRANRDRFSTAETLTAALACLWQRSRPGDAILLSPACASYDQFRDYVHRAETFIAAMRDIASGVAADSCFDQNPKTLLQA